MRTSVFATLLLSALAIMTPVEATATPITVIDQTNPDTFVEVGAAPGVSVAQGFVPTLTGLDAAELMLEPAFNTPTAISLNVRSGTPNGAILGTSLLTVVPGGINVVHFDFAATVPLTPGNFYFLEFVSTGVGVIGSESNSYPAGVFSLDGVVQNADRDAYFVEGLHAAVAPAPVPEPATLVLLTSGLLTVAVRRRQNRRER